METVTQAEVDAFLAEAKAKAIDVGEYALAEGRAAVERITETVKPNRPMARVFRESAKG